MLRAARELLAVRSPLDAELMVSELLGTWWGQRSGRHRGDVRRQRAAVEELVGEGLVEYAAQQGTPAALALLSGVACLGTPRQAARAEEAALDLMDRGVARPGWAEHVGAVASAECYVNSDLYGDRDEVICVFSYAGEEEHGLVVVVDYNAGGMARDGWVTSQVGKLLDYCRQSASTFARVEPPQARRLLEAALAVTEAAPSPPVSGSFPSYHAFIRARVRTLPPQARPAVSASGPASSRGPGGHGGSSATGAAGVSRRSRGAGRPGGAGGAGSAGQPGGAQRGLRLDGTGWPDSHPGPFGTAARRQTWRRDRRAALVAEFLASDEAEGLSDREAASRCADHIVEYGCERDFGRPLRMSPGKAETFLLDWLPRKVVLSPAEQHAMPHVLAAWVRWAGARAGLDADAVGRTLDAVFDSMGMFTRVYHDPASFGLEPDLVARLLPDSDLEALARRAFAFPLLRGRYRGTDLGTLDPARPADRRTLLDAYHDEPPGRPPVSQAGLAGLTHKASGASHIEDHLALADRLWRGDPPELWEAAQRLLDLGEERHAVMHTLINTIQAAGPDPDDIASTLAELADLPPEEPT
jgi:hypothetical protein